jgi:Leucine-rich repeat (LRR) protein
MKKISLIFILLLAACTTEPVEIHDDNAVLQKLVNDPTIECTELPDSICVWEDDRIILLNLFNQEISGQIPDEIGNLTELKQLGLKSNNLSGEIPESIGKLTNLTQLSLSNNLLSGNLPESLGNLSNLTLLDLSNNNLLGSIPNSVAELSALYTFSADSNSFSGSIPDGICNIENLDISNNQFCPPLPYCIDSPNLIGYQNCDTSCGSGNTYLNGYCYSQTDLDVLQGLIDSANSLNMVMDTDTIAGVQPLELGFQEWQSGRLKTLDCYWEADKCNLSGPLPSNIGNLDSLEYLDVQQNNITGGIPETLAELSALYTFSADSNSFSGSIPDGLCNIENLDISDNQFCPCYPSCIEDAGVQDISECIICENGFEQVCTVPSSAIIDSDSTECFNSAHLEVLRAIIDSSLATLPDSLDYLMDADSSGTIEPMELGSQFWENSLLTYLDVNNRGLSGRLPNSILDLNSLFVLNLAHNYLDGEIPLNICYFVNLLPLNWDASISSGLNSNLFNNRFCPPYPDCITPFVGEQDTSNCL